MKTTSTITNKYTGHNTQKTAFPLCARPSDTPRGEDANLWKKDTTTFQVDAIVNAKLTEDCSLSTQYVIHIAAPVLNGSARGEAVLLTFCLRRSLSFPSISTDVYTYLVAQVAKIMEIAHETPKIVWGLRKVVFCCFSDRDRVVNESLPREERVVYNY